MKATINGIAVEGTPEEIAQYERIKMQESQRKHTYPSTGDWLKQMRDSVDHTPWMQEQWKMHQNDICTTTNVPMDYQKWG